MTNITLNQSSENNLLKSNTLEVEEKIANKANIDTEESLSSDWLSPSDVLIGIIKLKAPFTSKIIRAKAHAGLLHIGDEILEAKYRRFHKQLKVLLDENDAAWQEILKHEQHQIKMKVRRWYENLFKEKCKTLTEEIDLFYKKTLQELETHLRSETKQALISLQVTMVTDLNIQIKRKLLLEKQILNNVLNKKFVNELSKVRRYYNLLLDNETDRCQDLINSTLIRRNDAIQALYTQLNSENLTSCMYIMSTERKKCRIKNFFLKSHLDRNITEHLQKLINRDDYLNKVKRGEKTISEINLYWEEKIRKILEMFTKFISFSLQLLPEQSNFLIQLEKLMILQLHEINKVPFRVSPILVDSEEMENVFRFPSPEVPSSESKKPFVIEGDTSIPIPKVYGSRETLPSDVELPFIIVDKDYIYAKCNKFEEIKEFIECQFSKSDSCVSQPSVVVKEECKRLPSPYSSLSWSEPEQVFEMSNKSVSSSWTEIEQEYVVTSSSSSASGVTVKSHPSSSSTAPGSSEKSRSDVARSETCPAKICIEWIKKFSFPYLNTYLDYNEQNYARVQAIVAKKRISKEPDLIRASQFAKSNLPFAQTDKRTYDIATQYSSQEDLLIASQQVSCPCIDNIDDACDPCNVGEPPSQLITEVLTRRDQSIYNLMKAHPELLSVFTDEKYDYEFLKL